MKDLKIITVIPARGGSKSIPNKNIKELGGLPLIAHSINYSRRCKLVTKTIVSTDNSEIANIAKKYGAEVPFLRPHELSKDLSQDYGFMRHALDFFDDINLEYDIFILLRPTSPLRPDGLIEKSIELLTANKDSSSVRTVAPVLEHPYRSWRLSDKGLLKPILDTCEEIYNLPRQVLPKYYFQTGDLEAIKRSTILSGSVSGPNIYPLIISRNQMIDIDTQEDYDQATKYLKSKSFKKYN